MRMRARGIPIVVAVFTSGAVLLGVEIAASRVLAPFFGSSLYVWGALIGVVLTGLAVGYWAGGAVADRLPATASLVAVLAAGAGLVLAIPFLDGRVLEAVVGWDPGPRLDPLLAAAILFGPPSIVLAGVTPIAVRLRASEVERLGRTAGRLFSVSTVGSIAGTFATAFWLIPELGTDQLLGVGAAALFAGAAVVAVSERLALRSLLAVAATGGAIAAAIALAPENGGTLSAPAARNWSPVYRLRGNPASGPALDLQGVKVLYRKDTQYHRLAVVEEGGTRVLRFGSSYQSAMTVSDPYAAVYPYTDFFELGLAYHPGARNVLFVGLGGASAPKRLRRDFPSLRLQIVELDPVVVNVARRFFGLPRDPRLAVAVEDGRRYLAGNEKRWDMIAIDVFYEDGIPFHMTTREFLELARSRLEPGGVVVTNVIGALEGPGSKLFRSIYRTYRSVFPTVLVHTVGGGGPGIQNLILVAGDGAAPAKGFLERRWRGILGRTPAAADLASAIEGRYDGAIAIGDVPTLTDDYAPTDALLLE
jgi:spermidine synthase